MFVCLKGFCDFEQHSCGWKNVSEDSYRWERQRANITLVPGVDHTTGNESGKYSHLLLCSILVITVVFLLFVCFLLIPRHYVDISALAVFLPCNTYVFDAGHVMYAEGEPSMFSLAILEYSVDKPAALGCQIRYSERVLPPSWNLCVVSMNVCFSELKNLLDQVDAASFCAVTVVVFQILVLYLWKHNISKFINLSNCNAERREERTLTDAK